MSSSSPDWLLALQTPEGSGGTNLSAGLWYPPKSYYLEGAPKAQFQNATTEGHKTGETCGSVFWVKLKRP